MKKLTGKYIDVIFTFMKRILFLFVAAALLSNTAKAWELPSSSDYFCRLSADGSALLKTEFKTAVSDTLLAFSDMRVTPIDSVIAFVASPDGTRLLLTRSKGDNYIYRIESNRCDPLSDAGPQYYPVFSPDGKKMAFVRDGDVYIKRLEYNTEVRVTEDGKDGSFNGSRGYDYAEAFGQEYLLEFSPDGMYLLFAKNNGVRLYSLQYKWTKNFSTSNGDIYYVTNAKWLSDGQSFLLTCTDAKQSKFNVLKVNSATLVAKTIYNYKAEPFVSPQSASFLFPVSTKGDFLLMCDKGSARVLYRLNANGKVLNAVSPEDGIVSDFYGVDGQRAYFQLMEGGLWQRDLCSASLSGGKTSILAGDSAINAAIMENGTKYMLLTQDYQCSGSKTFVINSTGKRQCVIKSAEGIAGRKIIDVDGIPVTVTPSQGDSKALVILAAAYDEMAGWEKSLAERGFAVAKPEINYKNGNLLHDWFLEAYLAPAEIYSKVAKAMKDKGYANKKVVVLGKGLSAGSALASVLSDEGNYIDAIVAISPVTDLRQYNKLLISRLMLTDGATDAYRRNSPADNVEKLNKPLLLVQAMNDKHVAASKTFDFIAKTVDAGKLIDIQIYPGKDENYTSDSSSTHLLDRISLFIEKL